MSLSTIFLETLTPVKYRSQCLRNGRPINQAETLRKYLALRLSNLQFSLHKVSPFIPALTTTTALSGVQLEVSQDNLSPATSCIGLPGESTRNKWSEIV